MTVLRFPDRKAEVATRRLRARRRPAVTLLKAGLVLWFMPALWWVSLIDALAEIVDDEEDRDRGG